MEKSEPTLVPEWLKNAGSLNGGGSISHSDDHKFVRNKSFVSSSSRSDRANSSSFRRSSSSNGSSNSNPYSNFGRNRHDRDWGKDTYDSRNKVTLGDRRHRNSSDPLEDTLSSKSERDVLRRSQSMIKHVDTWPKRGVIDSSSNNGLLTKKKTSFERDFPSLGIEERTITSEIRRVPSPGLSSAIQSLPIGNVATIGGEKWTSALAEVPALVGSKGTGSPSSQVATSLNMAEAVAQGPTRAQTTPQSSVGTQKLEELAIKQSRQLIPMTPSMPKALVSTSSDKQKTKGGPHPIPSLLLVNHSPRGGPVKGDIAKTSSNVGKLQVLKPVREKDNPSPTTAITPTRGPPINPIPDRKTVLEKRPTSQALSRKEFFNSVRKKSVPNSAAVAESASPSEDKPTEIDVVLAGDVSPNGPRLCEVELSSEPVVPDEEEAAFLRSLGWEENSDEGGLTEEEINAFFRDVAKYIKSKPSLKMLQGVKPKFSSPYDSKMGAISSGLNPPDAKLES